jgi:hypothetical protein
VTCPKCQRAAPFHGHRPFRPVSVLGQITCYRAYYYCGRCALGLFPFDEQAGFNDHRLSAGAERVVCLLGQVCDSFEEAAKKALPEACGLRLGESTVQRTTEDAGKRLGETLRQGHTLGSPAEFDWHKDALGRTCAYVGIDAIGVPQQAEGGGKAECRMSYVAMVYNPPPGKDESCARADKQEARTPAQPAEPSSGLPLPGYQPVAETAAAAGALPGQPAAGKAKAAKMQARYLSGLYGLDELGLQLRRQAAQVGMERAQRWIALSEAGNGLEDFLRCNFNRPDLVVILDFYHPAGYLEKLAIAWHPGQPEQAQALTKEWCHLLKHQGGEAMLAALKGLSVPRRQAVRAAYAEALTYFTNHKGRMDYPFYLSQGWQIGSGPVESGCKTVVGQRLKLAGMRWREYGTDGVCHLRALFKSDKGQWDAFWERKVNKRPINYQRMSR